MIRPDQKFVVVLAVLSAQNTKIGDMFCDVFARTLVVARAVISMYYPRRCVPVVVDSVRLN